MIFVFGSNLAGIHGAGAAKVAHEQHGARWGFGEGLYGNSYALPTKDWKINTLSLSEISVHIARFINVATYYHVHDFQITQIGCGLAGYTPKEIAPLFISATGNCYFDTAWEPYLPNNFKYWGTF